MTFINEILREQENGSNVLTIIILINDIFFIKGTYFLFITF